MPGLKPALSNKRHHHNEKPSCCNQRKPVSSNRDPVWSKHKYINNKVNFKVFEPLVPSAWTACRQSDAMHSYAAAPGTRGWANPGPAPRNRGWRGVGKLRPCPPGPLGTGGGGGPAPQAAQRPASPLPLDLGLPVCGADTFPCWWRCGEGRGP